MENRIDSITLCSQTPYQLHGFENNHLMVIKSKILINTNSATFLDNQQIKQANIKCKIQATKEVLETII